MVNEIETGITFDDLTLVPQYSELPSRDAVSLGTTLGDLELDIPVVSAPMDSVTEASMASFMSNNGGLGVIHRYCTIDEQVNEVTLALNYCNMVGVAVGINGDSWERAERLIDAGATFIVLDVAHGDTLPAIRRLEDLKNKFYHTAIMSANICTYSAARHCIDAGADVLRVGMGSGSACTTRVVAGCGVPQATAIQKVSNAIGLRRVALVADGGIRNSGDIVKALALGADAVMLGGMLANYLVSAAQIILTNDGDTTEDLQKVVHTWLDKGKQEASEIFEKGIEKVDLGNWKKKKLFRGMASESALSEHKQGQEYIVEGEHFLLDIDYDFEKTFKTLLDGVRLGLSYLGARNLNDLRNKAEFLQVTSNGYREALPHKGG